MGLKAILALGARRRKSEEGRKKKEEAGRMKNEEEGRKKQEERRKQNKKKSIHLYTLTPDHPALLAPYYIIYNIYYIMYNI